jgi:SAM-dependent methyltransferase
VALGPHSKEPAADPAGGQRAPGVALGGRPCGGLARALARAFRGGKPEILVLGPLCGDSVVYLAGRGARVHVDDFEPPPPLPVRRPGDPPIEVTPFRLDQPDRTFDLVLAWEVADFVPPDRLVEYGAELRRVLRDGGGLFFLSHSRPEPGDDRPSRYLLLSDDLILRQVVETERRPRYVHPTRDLEQALRGLAIQGIQLQRNQMREITAQKAGTA